MFLHARAQDLRRRLPFYRRKYSVQSIYYLLRTPPTPSPLHVRPMSKHIDRFVFGVLFKFGYRFLLYRYSFSSFTSKGKPELQLPFLPPFVRGPRQGIVGRGTCWRRRINQAAPVVGKKREDQKREWRVWWGGGGGGGRSAAFITIYVIHACSRSARGIRDLMISFAPSLNSVVVLQVFPLRKKLGVERKADRARMTDSIEAQNMSECVTTTAQPKWVVARILTDVCQIFSVSNFEAHLKESNFLKLI